MRMKSIRKKNYEGWDHKTNTNTNPKIIIDYKKITIRRIRTKFDKTNVNSQLKFS
jgi:hypothetical protein